MSSVKFVLLCKHLCLDVWSGMQSHRSDMPLRDKTLSLKRTVSLLNTNALAVQHAAEYCMHVKVGYDRSGGVTDFVTDPCGQPS